nr:CocE/NonD family hydrolase [Chitinophaga nivalis]
MITTPAATMMKTDDARRYHITDSILIRTPAGATLTALVVRPRKVIAPLPAALFYTIYANQEQHLYRAKQAAAHGYAGVVVDARGKRLSPDEPAPYEQEVHDVPAAIDWVSRQPWCNGKVGMYGGSYSGFAQWAATRHLHPALKTIVPYVAAIPGQGVPMENNIFLTVNYQWAFYVTNNKYLDDAVNDDWQHWRQWRNTWYESGAAFRKIDSIDGRPNRWLQRWLQHPAYDRYWQDMIPDAAALAKLDIPVLTIEGYYDDGQISGLQYVKDHTASNPRANHYVIIGPYDHFGTQTGGTPVLREYTVDPVALIDTREITFQWLDYVMKDSAKPALLQDKVNFEVMGTNTWKHAPSLEKMSDTVLRFYLSDKKSGVDYLLTPQLPAVKAGVPQEVDWTDRKSANGDYYPDPIVKDTLDRSTGVYFISEPLDKPMMVNGMFSGVLKAMINKKDMDVNVVLYEVMPDGRYFHLSYYLGRASYAADRGIRHLLTPGVTAEIPFSRTRLVSRQLRKGSRLLVVVDINKNPFAEINYGTGKAVSDETIADAGVPLQIKWGNDSYVDVPVAY